MRDEVLGGRYRLVRMLGEGGMGQVWEARDEALDRPVAVKLISLLSGGGNNGSVARARFLREARITARLQHPNIVTIHDVGETGEGDAKVPFLVMELVRGEGLDVKLRRGPVGSRDTARWGAQVCDALAEAHREGIMHRDVKPSNVLVTPSGIVKVLDFGVARAADPYATADRLTQTGFIVGTPPYMAPEQARGYPEPRSDLYAVGCLLFELVTGRLPFQAPDTVGYLSAHLTQEPPTPGSVAPGVPAAWDELVPALLRKEPEQRYGDAPDVADALRRLGDAPEHGPEHAPRPVPAQAPIPPQPALPPTALVTPALPVTPAPHVPPVTPAASTVPLTPANPAVPGRGAARAAVTFAVLCLPGIAYMITACVNYLGDSSAPHAVIQGNLALAVVEVVDMVVGATLFLRRILLGRLMLVAAGVTAALHGLSVSVQYQVVGGPPDIELIAHTVGPLTALAAIGAVVAATRPAAKLWCRGPAGRLATGPADLVP